MSDNFYSISAKETGEGTLSGTLHFNGEHSVFKGHFPGNPIVPGVCTLAIIKGLLENATGQKLRLSTADMVKFLGLLAPGMSPRVSISWKEQEGLKVVTASLQDGMTWLFKMSATYIPAIQ